MTFSRLVAAAFALVFVGAAFAQQAPPVAVRATIEAVAEDGGSLSVRTRSGEAATVRLQPTTSVTLVVPATLADVKPGLFIGVAAMPGEGGVQNALEVHIFPESMRGVGEGFRPFDLAPGSTMTNGDVEARVDSVDGPKLTVTYGGGQQTIVVGKSTPIVALTPGARDDLKAGAAIIARGVKAADGAYEATRILVGKDGLTPPM
ncbi:MAG: hypothetical protein ABSC25_09880 [Roseiarcus sp.]|jgi:hypothetical protein